MSRATKSFPAGATRTAVLDVPFEAVDRRPVRPFHGFQLRRIRLPDARRQAENPDPEQQPLELACHGQKGHCRQHSTHECEYLACSTQKESEENSLVRTEPESDSDGPARIAISHSTHRPASNSLALQLSPLCRPQDQREAIRPPRSRRRTQR